MRILFSLSVWFDLIWLEFIFKQTKLKQKIEATNKTKQNPSLNWCLFVCVCQFLFFTVSFHCLFWFCFYFSDLNPWNKKIMWINETEKNRPKWQPQMWTMFFYFSVSNEIRFLFWRKTQNQNYYHHHHYKKCGINKQTTLLGENSIIVFFLLNQIPNSHCFSREINQQKSACQHIGCQKTYSDNDKQKKNLELIENNDECAKSSKHHQMVSQSGHYQYMVCFFNYTVMKWLLCDFKNRIFFFFLSLLNHIMIMVMSLSFLVGYCLTQWFSTSVPRHFSVPRNSENATVIYSKILKLCRDNKKVENHWSNIMSSSLAIILLEMKWNEEVNIEQFSSFISSISINKWWSIHRSIYSNNGLIIFLSACLQHWKQNCNPGVK